MKTVDNSRENLALARQSEKISISKTKKLGLAGLGIISLCGLACSLPVLVGGLIVGAAAVWSVLSLTWPIALGLVALAATATWFYLAAKNNRTRTSRWLRRKADYAGAESFPGQQVIASACNAGGRCDCKPQVTGELEGQYK
ncbi:MAG TPA: hypothetical protein VH186_16500 [Chloroflexia bacterium]|nr:hypothetical protein [Chloroflexia bacterium]